ncbi:MAG: OB-fold nucleic acid binding domain-containing protein, partial [Phycisphaerae bacterium]
MNRNFISELKNHIEREVTLCGWLYNSRSSGKVQFLVLRDGTGLCQCIVEQCKVPDET